MAPPDKLRSLWPLWLIAAVGLCIAVIVIATFHHPAKRLKGLLVDLELYGPDRWRYKDLRVAITKKIPAEVEFFRGYEIELDYRHFSELSPATETERTCDFVILSPQSTPWHMYKGTDGEGGPESAMAWLRNVVLNENLPVLGICGGHQFLAMAFGGRVDFIDPEYCGRFPEKYPRGGISERGQVVLTTLADDPILKGVASHPGRFRAVESHYEEVKTVPHPFVNLASSPLSPVQLIRMPGKAVYGTAFHPERGWKAGRCEDGEGVPEGRRLLANFLNFVADRSSDRSKHGGGAAHRVESKTSL
jgi:GMP synthase-like glutamine amidotransferase